VSDDVLARSLVDLRSTVGLIRLRAIGELSRLGDPRAIDALSQVAVGDVEDRVRSDAARAIDTLKRRTRPSDDIGETTEQWTGRVLKKASTERVPPQAGSSAKTRKLVKKDLEAPAPPTVTVRSSAAENARALEATRARPPAEAARARKELLDEALAGLGIQIEAKRYGFKLIVPLLNGRKQFVRVGYEQSDFESDKVIVVFSPCGRAKQEHYRWALELNHGLSYGKLGLVAGPQGDEFVMSATLLEATADPAEVRKAILSVAEKADKVEAKFSPEDRL